MLYERFFKWLTFNKRRHCKHEWVKFKETSKVVYYEFFYYDHFKCSLCGKKEKRYNLEKHSSGTYIML